jgi:hypothetical protein
MANSVYWRITGGGLVSTLQKLFRGPPACQWVVAKGVGWGGVQSLLTASRRTNPGVVASIGLSEVILPDRKSDALIFFRWSHWARIG